MKHPQWAQLVVIILIALLAVTASVTAQPPVQKPAAEPSQGLDVAGDLANGFYYQGVLTENGVPVNGVRDMEFRLYDASSGGSQVGSTISKRDRKSVV